MGPFWSSRPDAEIRPLRLPDGVVVGRREGAKDGGIIGPRHRLWIASSLARRARKKIPEITSMLNLAMLKMVALISSA
jgi:hypothetical protein